MIAAADAAGMRVAVNHQYREKPIYRAVMDEVGGQDVGRIVFTQVVQLMDLAPWDEPVQWRAAMPNRTLFEGGVHLVDLLLALYGEQPVAVWARHSPGLDTTRRRPTRSISSPSSSAVAGSRRSRSTGSARPGPATSSSASTARRPASERRTVGESWCRPG